MEIYLDIQTQSSFTIPCFVLLEDAFGIELDDPALHSLLVLVSFEYSVERN